MKKYLLIALIACSTLSGFGSCSNSKDSEIQNNPNLFGTWLTADAIEQMTAVFGSDKSLLLTVKSSGKTTSVQTYSYFVEGNKLTTVFIQATPASSKKKGDIDVISISLNGDKLIMGELSYTRVK
ncbi:hypothetical protein [Sphingobacterium sp.]|uniref:hypothetical protein n=1 Tax=Sphingobacterium sp. TaxID=341027 RepID=UPI00289B7A37|nr:hypothetical protein [Sphingobacterium sp.]